MEALDRARDLVARMATSRWWPYGRWVVLPVSIINLWIGLTVPQQAKAVADAIGVLGQKGVQWLLTATGLGLIALVALVRPPAVTPFMRARALPVGRRPKKRPLKDIVNDAQLHCRDTEIWLKERKQGEPHKVSRDPDESLRAWQEEGLYRQETEREWALRYGPTYIALYDDFRAHGYDSDQITYALRFGLVSETQIPMLLMEMRALCQRASR